MFLWSWVILSKNKECPLYWRLHSFLFVQDHFQEHFEAFFMVLVKFIHEYFTLFVPIMIEKTFFPMMSFLSWLMYFCLFLFFNIIKIYTVLTQQYDANSIQVPIDAKLGNMNIFRDIKQGAKITWSKDTEIMQSLYS